MTSFFTILLIGISLSMDAFSLSLIYGMVGISEKNKIKLAIIVGIFHFFMPIIGNILGYFISDISYINLDIVACVILLYIGTSLIISNFKDEDVINNGNNYLMFGLSVSIDSMMVGVGLKAITSNYFMASSIFSITSFSFTYAGLLLGSAIGKKIGKYAKVVGGVILIMVAFGMFIC